MAASIIFRKSPDYSRCPSCHNIGSMRRSHSRTPLEHIINHVTFLRTYRCKNCGWRGYLSTLSFTAKSFKNLLFYLVLAIASAYFIRIILSKYFS